MNAQTSEEITNPANSPVDGWLSKIILRQAVETDLPAMEWEGEYAHFRRLYKSCYERSKMGITMIWLAELEGRGIIGQTIIQLNCDRPELADGKQRAYLFGLRVRPAYRNYGLGTLLIRVIENDLVHRGYHALTLNVAKDNPNAMRLYNRLGFLIVAFEPGIWSYQDQNDQWHTVKEPAWRMEKRLFPR